MVKAPQITAGFWRARLDINARRAIFHQWEQLERSGCIDNFRIAARQKEGFREGYFFADSDAYKWLDAASRILGEAPDPQLSTLVEEFITLLEELTMKTNMAMMDAGLRVLFNGDDMAFKTGPMMNPKVLDEMFGPSYTRITKAVHDRGGRVLLHSCGDNTKLFDLFIKWGFDGGHSYENTSNVDIEYEKKTHGDRFTIVGGVGVDYILTERSKPKEVVDETKRLLRMCAPGGRFLLGPVHDHPDMDIEKVKIMLETAWEYGAYPIRA